jgi:hypothetical protein
MRKLPMPSLAIDLLNRIYACSALPWHVIVAEGDRTERAARHLVHRGLIRVWPHRKEATLTNAGRNEVYRRLVNISLTI